MAVARERVIDEHELYPVHEEDTLPERPEHEYQVWLLKSMLRTRLPQHWTTGDICMYWEERNFHQYVAPDVLVVRGPAPVEPPGVYLAWTDPPALLTIEIGSRSTLREDEGPKVSRYLIDLGVPEYLHFTPHRNPRRRTLALWRLQGEEPVQVRQNRKTRLLSQTLDLEFGLDERGVLRLYERDGRPLPAPEELQQQAQRVQALEEEVERLKAELKRQSKKADR